MSSNTYITKKSNVSRKILWLKNWPKCTTCVHPDLGRPDSTFFIHVDAKFVLIQTKWIWMCQCMLGKNICLFIFSGLKVTIMLTIQLLLCKNGSNVSRTNIIKFMHTLKMMSMVSFNSVEDCPLFSISKKTRYIAWIDCCITFLGGWGVS